MRPDNPVVGLALLLCGMLLLTACAVRATVGELKADPSRYHNKAITVAGTVTESYGALGTGAYAIDDGSGTLWVITQQGVPGRGARVGVKGRLQTGFSIGGRTFGTVLVESDRSAP
jgi:hypothetical protein